MFDIYLLGTGGTMPLHTRALASCYVRVEGIGFLFDCGEGTQTQLQKSGVSPKHIDYICITHIHADHISGLMGLLLAIEATKRTEPITIIAPAIMKKYMDALSIVMPTVRYPLKYNFIDNARASNTLRINIAPNIVLGVAKAAHGIPCYSFNLKLSRRPMFLHEKAIKFDLPKPLWSYLARGEDVEYKGVMYKSMDFLDAPRQGLKMAYVVDTRPYDGLADFIGGADLVVMEGMYRDEEDKPKALKNRHMMWSEAISLAKGRVGKLVLTHYSPALTIAPTDLETVQKAMSNCFLGRDNDFFSLKYI